MKKLFKHFFAILLVLLLSFIFACSETPERNNQNNGEIEHCDELLIGMYGIYPQAPAYNNENIVAFKDAVEGDMYNVFLMGQMSEKDLDFYGEMVFKAGKKFWMFGQDIIWTNSGGVILRNDCYVRLNNFKKMVTGKVWYDAFMGLNIDEPLLQGMSAEDLYEGTKAFRNVFPDKRFHVNFAGYAFNTDLNPYTGDRMTKETGEFITDISFDMYGKINDTILETYDNMVNMFKGENKYFWAVPMAMSFTSQGTPEEYSIEHLEVFFDLIKKTKGGVGLMLYSAWTIPWEYEQIGSISMYDLLVSEEVVKTWNTKPKPYSSYYEKLYDSNGNPKGEGHKPWTALESKIKAVYAEMEQYNVANRQLLESKLKLENNQTFEFDGNPHKPAITPSYLKCDFKFTKADEEVYFENAPSAVGKYLAVITLKESVFRKGAEFSVFFEITESTKTVIAQANITENYSASSSSVSINQSGLKYSFDGINYNNYVQNQIIDVTSLVVVTERPKCIYFVEGTKDPFILPLKTLKRASLFSFENKTTSAYSTFVYASNRKFSGESSAFCSTANTVDTGGFGYRNDFNLINGQFPISTGNTVDLTGAIRLEMYIYAESPLVNFYASFTKSSWQSAHTFEKKQISANKWTKISFDLTNMTDKTFTFDNLNYLFFYADVNVNYYVDQIELIML